MEKSNRTFGGADLPATTDGDSPDVAPAGRTPVASFGQTSAVAQPAGGADKGVTLSLRCRVTLRSGAGFGGADTAGPHMGGSDIGGPHIGGGDAGGRDLVVEIEGSASLSGGPSAFGGSDIGGPHIGGADTGGPRVVSPDKGGNKGGGGRRQLSSKQTYEADRGKGGSKAG